jgi:poly(A) polymerase
MFYCLVESSGNLWVFEGTSRRLSVMRRRLPPSNELPELPSFRVEEDVVRVTGAAAGARRREREQYGGFGYEVQESEPAARPENRKDPGSRYEGTGLTRHAVALTESRIDQDAARVVRKLEKAGFEAYLVGGCVRDLLLGGTPKDYDVATSARPEDVRRLFRNCRVIGRRFRLAHVLFANNKIVEVATFRRPPPEVVSVDPDLLDDEDEELIIRNDNAFGDAPEDARRRDFTVNALFYDLDRKEVLDWCGGMADIHARTLRVIGEPSVRFREDPIRILRAIKFAARLDLGIDKDVYFAMISHMVELSKAAKPRLGEEILRLLRGGEAARSIHLLWESGALAELLPELASFVDDDGGREGGAATVFARLRALDGWVKVHGPPSDVCLWLAILFAPLREATSGVRKLGNAVDEFLEPIVRRIALPRRAADSLRRSILVLSKMRPSQARASMPPPSATGPSSSEASERTEASEVAEWFLSLERGLLPTVKTKRAPSKR